MLTHVRAAIVSLAVFTVITGVAYPVLVTAIAQITFPPMRTMLATIAGTTPSAAKSLCISCVRKNVSRWRSPIARPKRPNQPACSFAGSGSVPTGSRPTSSIFGVVGNSASAWSASGPAKG